MTKAIPPEVKGDKEIASRSTESLHRDGDHWLLTGPNSPAVQRDRLGLVPALENAIAIIEALNSASPQVASLADLSVALKISRSHCHSILKTLTGYGWLRFDERTKVYQLDIGILASISSIFRSGQLETVRIVMNELVHRLNLPLVISKPQSDLSYLLVDKFNVSHGLEVGHPIGYRYPRDAVGQMRAFLAWQPPNIIDAWLDSWEPVRYTRRTKTTRSEVLAELQKSRERGYVRSDEEFAEGLLAFCLPIFDHESNVAFIVSCTTVKEALLKREASISSDIFHAVKRIHDQTGARPPYGFPTALPRAT